MTSSISTQDSRWNFCGDRVPKQEVVFICQLIATFCIVIVALVNLSLGHPNRELWATLVGAGFGYLVHRPQQIVFPEPDKCKLTFDSRRCEHPFDFHYVADFESILKPHDNDDNDPTLVNTHDTAGFCLHRITPHENYQTPPITYSERNAIEKFLEHIFAESEKINEIMSVQRPMKPLEKVEGFLWYSLAHEKATTCRICKSPFTESNPKCHHHNHVSGDYLFAACQDCNLKLKPKSLSPRLRRGPPVSQFGFLRLGIHSKKFQQKIRGTRERERHDVLRRRRGHIVELGKNHAVPNQKLVFADSFQFLSATLTPSSRY